MTKHWKEFLILFTCSIILMFILGKPARDYIPIIFGLTGFARFMTLAWCKFYELSEHLVSDQKDLLIKNGIDFKNFKSHSTVDFFTLLTQRKKLINEEPSLKSDLNQLYNLIILTIISFLGFAIIGTLSVLLTWQKTKN